MVTNIFEGETEIGKCRCADEGGERWPFAEPDYARIFAHTTASLNGHRGMLRVEQQCYLRRGGELPDQPWISPEVLLEPVLNSGDKLTELAKQLHERFILRIRQE